MRRYAASSDVLNRWVELGVTSEHVFLFFLTYMNPYYLGGYLMRGSLQLNDPSSPPLRLNQWNFINLHNGTSVNFFVSGMNDFCITGHLVRSEIATFDYTLIRYQQFLDEYNRQFDPALLAKNSQIPLEERLRRGELVQRAKQTLQSRVTLREQAARSKRIPQQDELPTLADEDLRYLSDKQLELYRDFFDQDGDIDDKALQAIFKLRESGELQGIKHPGSLQPDSASEFMAAEFALHAIEQQIEPDIWAKLLITFVNLQNFKYDQQQADEEQADEEQKEHLQQTYNTMSMEELKHAYADNLLKAAKLGD